MRLLLRRNFASASTIIILLAAKRVSLFRRSIDGRYVIFHRILRFFLRRYQPAHHSGRVISPSWIVEHDSIVENPQTVTYLGKKLEAHAARPCLARSAREKATDRSYSQRHRNLHASVQQRDLHAFLSIRRMYTENVYAVILLLSERFVRVRLLDQRIQQMHDLAQTLSSQDLRDGNASVLEFLD